MKLSSKKLLNWGPKLLVAAMLVVAFTAGGVKGAILGGVDGAVEASNHKAQTIVDTDPAITAYKVFSIMLYTAAGEPIEMKYRLPMIVPTPAKQTHFFTGVRLTEHLGALQFTAKDGSHVVTILIDHYSYEGLVVSYYIIKDKLMYRYMYDKDHNPQACTKEQLDDFINGYGKSLEVE